MRTYERAHPVTVFFNLGRVFYLIIIPVLRGFISALQGGFAGWVSGAWMDILVFVFMIGVSVWVWLAEGFYCGDDIIGIKTGLIRRRYISIPWSKVTTIMFLESFYLRPVKALRLRADTLGGSFKKPDFTILISKKQAEKILDISKLDAGTPISKVYQPTTGSIVALSLLTSNSFGGVVFLSALISQSGKLLGREFSERIIGTFEQVTRNLAFGIIPPAAAATAYILLAGWLIGFLLEFLRYKNFTLTRRETIFEISGGIFTKRVYHIRYSDINYIDIRQSVATKILKLYTLYIYAVGYGKHKDDISCIIPAETGELFEKNRKKIFPRLNPMPRQLAPERKGIMRFISDPLLCIIMVLAAVLFLCAKFPSWSGFILFVALMALVPTAFFLCIRILDFSTGGLAVTDESYVLRYSKGLMLHTVVIPLDKVSQIELKQGLFQQFGRYCDLIVHAKAEGKSIHRCRNLVKAELEKIVFG